MGTLADIATALRFGIAAYILYAGLAGGRETFGSVAAMMLVGWTLDTVDGHLARAAGDRPPSWLGRNERLVDAGMVVAGFLYLALIGVVPVWASLVYLLAAAVVLWRIRSIALLTALEAPLMLLFLITAFRVQPVWGWIYVAWGILAAILDWRRLKVRIQILWSDVRRTHEPGHDSAPQPPVAGPGQS